MKMFFSSLTFVTLFILLYSKIEKCQTLNCYEQNGKKMSKAGEPFIFECTENGNYKPMQCEPRTGYCFCVDVFDGFIMRDTTFRHEQKNDVDCTKVNNAPLSGSPSGEKRSLFTLLDDSTSKPIIAKEETFSSSSELKPQRDSYPHKTQQQQPHHHHRHSSSSDTKISQLNQCNQNDRLNFLQNLRKTLNDLNDKNRGFKKIKKSTSDRYFRQIDSNKDNFVDKNEFEKFEKYIKNITNTQQQAILVESCTNSLHRYCDQNDDQKLTMGELLLCLNRNHVSQINNKQRRTHKQTKENASVNWRDGTLSTTTKPRVARNGTRKRQQNKSERNSEDVKIHSTSDTFNVQNESTPNDRIKENRENLQLYRGTSSSSNANNYESMSTLSFKNDSHQKQRQQQRKSSKANDSSRFDCLVVRENAIKTNSKLIPQCSNNGGYVPMQCLLDSCWCVSPITGQIIIKVLNSTQHSCERIYKGCSHKQRSMFHQELHEQLQTMQLTCSKAFTFYDTDRDGFIRSKELKPLKKILRGRVSSETRRCIRSEMSFCDQDLNGELSLEEWMFCCDRSLNNYSRSDSNRNQHGVSKEDEDFATQKEEELRRVYNEKKSLPRNGPNPFQFYLKSD